MKLIFFRPLAGWLGALALISACSKTPDKQKEAPSAAVLDQEFAARRDTLAVRWRELLAADDQQLFYTKRLLQELALVPGTDKDKLRTLEQGIERLKQRRYAAPGALHPDSVDAYDDAQRRVLDPAISLAAPFVADTLRYPLVGELTDDLQAYYNGVIMVRSHYDEAARAYNAWLATNRAQVPAAATAPPALLFSPE